MRALRSHWAILLLLFFAPTAMHAQALATGTVSGTVTDPSGAAVMAAELILQDTATNSSRKQQTNNVGQYSFSNVAPGVYKITATMQGFRQAVVASLQVFAGTSYVVNLKLQVGALHETVEVRPTVAESPRVAEQAERVETVTIMTSEELDTRHASTVGEALGAVPGIATPRRQVLALGAHGGDLLIRGIGRSGSFSINQDIAVFIDDRPDFSGMSSAHFEDFFNLDNIERLEVIRGPSSLLYGSGALGGVINITTRDPGPGWAADVQALGGSFGTTENFARISYGGSRTFGLFGFNGRRTDGHRPHSAFNGENLYLKGGHRLSNHFTAGVQWGYNTFNLQDPGPVGARPGLLDESTWHTGGGVKLVGRFDKSETSILAWGSGGRFRFVGPVLRGSETTDRNFGARFKESLFLFKGNTLVFGTDVIRFGGTRHSATPTLPGRSFAFTQFVTEAEPYVFVEQNVRRVTLNGGLRVTAHSQFGVAVSPEGGIIVHALKKTAVRARVSRGFRAPNVTELFVVSASNPDLQPEHLTQYEVGVNQRVGSRLIFDLVGFVQQGDNFLQLVPSPALGGNLQFRNTGEFSHHGLESTVTLRLLERLRLSFASANLRLARDTAVVPLNSYSLDLLYMPRNFVINLHGYYASELFGQNNRQQRLPDYFVAGAKVSYRLLKRYRLFVEIDNITDKSYQTVPSFPMPGVSAFAGLSVSFWPPAQPGSTP